jgi:hypothetical protein
LDVPSSLKQLLARARRREVSQLALDVTALSTGILMAGAIVLLLAGTEILNWYWLVLLFSASSAAGAYRLRKTISSRYALAQRIDRRMQLADELSTAFYFEENPRPDRASVCERQREHAERVAGQVDVRVALPFKRSRFLMPAGILAMAALGMFAVRYLVVGSLDLGPSLVRIAYDSFFGNKAYEAENHTKRLRFDPATGQPNPDSPSLENDLKPDETLDAGQSQEGNADASDNAKEAAEGSNQSKEDGKQNGENDKNAGNDPSQQNGKEQDKNDAKDGDQNKNDKQDSKSGNNNSSLMDKMRDAVSDLMNKLKSNDKQEKSDKSQKSQAGDSKQKADKGQQSQDQQSQNSSQQDQQGQQGDEKQQSDASNDKKASDKSVSQDSKNGIGAQDGEKAIKEAAQLQAMGKITEILGKRSAQITGEVMVEVGSSKQQLKTPLASSDAKHAEAGSELHRDEVPLLYQPFVQQYFEEIRKGQNAPVPANAKK